MTSAVNPPDYDLVALRELWGKRFAGEDGRIRAWTFVPKAFAEQILAGTIQECPIELSDDEPSFRMAYQWMMESMDKSGIPGRKPGMSPWWCWICAGEGHVKPTNRHSDDSTVLLELSLNPTEVLMSDFSMWHTPLNYWFNAEEDEDAEFEKELDTAGLNIYRMKPLPEPFHSRVQRSWLKIFALDEVNGFTSQLPEKGIQGVFWRLRPEIIKGIVEPDEFINIEE